MLFRPKVMMEGDILIIACLKLTKRCEQTTTDAGSPRQMLTKQCAQDTVDACIPLLMLQSYCRRRSLDLHMPHSSMYSLADVLWYCQTSLARYTHSTSMYAGLVKTTFHCLTSFTRCAHATPDICRPWLMLFAGKGRLRHSTPDNDLTM